VEITAPYTGAGLRPSSATRFTRTRGSRQRPPPPCKRSRCPRISEGKWLPQRRICARSRFARDLHEPAQLCVLPFKVNQEARHTHIAITCRKSRNPVSHCRSYDREPATQAVVYAVDEGILQVARYTLPVRSGYSFASSVGGCTRQTVDLILPEYSMSGAGRCWRRCG